MALILMVMELINQAFSFWPTFLSDFKMVTTVWDMSF